MLAIITKMTLTQVCQKTPQEKIEFLGNRNHNFNKMRFCNNGVGGSWLPIPLFLKFKKIYIGFLATYLSLVNDNLPKIAISRILIALIYIIIY